MIDFWKVVWVGKKRLSNKTMYPQLFTATIYAHRHLEIATTISLGYKYLGIGTIQQ